MSKLLTRRRLITTSLAGGAGLALTSTAGLGLTNAGGRLIERAAASATPCSSLSDIEHVVMIIQENRSFDNYFGTYPGVAGFSDPRVLRQPGRGNLPIWYQFGWGPGDQAPARDHYLLPFHLDTAHTNAECTNDITHAWVAQHQAWNGGAMDRWVATHVAAGNDGVIAGPMTMGYYTRADLGFYHALADAFTLCDQYHCSVLGPSTPNQLFTLSATIDPHGHAGGPVADNPTARIPQAPGGVPFAAATETASFSWTTMPEALQHAGVSWKFYQPPGSQALDFISNNSLLYFPKFRDPSSELFRRGLAPTFPGQFQLDVASGTLPQVSWVTTMSGLDEHPPSPIVNGEITAVGQVLATLMANPAVWERTVVFMTYDENGGFFDHVPPPVPPPGTPDEWLTVPAKVGEMGGIRGPIGLGFRVPMLVLSPFSVGGLVCSEVFDHTSMLRFVERRFGVRVPNLSHWRRSVTGDLTSAINFAAGPKPARAPAVNPDEVVRVAEECLLAAPLDGAMMPQPYPVPPNGRLPRQAPGRPKRPSGPVRCT
ncbi:MAG: phospholipase C [Acidimicrobiales bacterium]